MLLKEIFEKAALGNGISCDSRHTQKGNIFVSVPCAEALTYTKTAIQKGATVVVAHTEICVQLGSIFPEVSFVQVQNPRLALAKLAQAFYKKQPDTIIAVTGTNGKSSVVSMLKQLWERNGLPSASLGTLGLTTSVGLDEDLKLPSLTSFGPLDFHKTLRALKESDINHLAIEASSHGLDQYRLDGATIKAAAFTNLTQDHLDYHGTLDAYFQAKARLFSEVLPKESPVVLNADSPYFDKLSDICRTQNHSLISYSLTKDADFSATNIQPSDHSIRFDLTTHGETFPSQTIPLAGIFQLENLLCALALANSTGLSIPSLVSTFPSLQSVKGRMDYVGEKNQAPIFVDYAHTPDALKCVLENLRPHTKGQLWVVFGCGGNRDKEKRPQMGKIADQLADKIIVTDDNPRLEDPATIRAEIMTACPRAQEISSRAKAIAVAIAGLNPDDVLLVAGKGHETGQTIGSTVYPFSDQDEILKHL